MSGLATRRSRTLEWLEYAGLVFGGDPQAMVFDRELDFGAGSPLDPQLDGASLTILERVRDQIEDDFLNSGFVPVSHGLVCGLERDFASFGFDFRSQAVQSLERDLRQVGLFASKRHGPRVEF